MASKQKKQDATSNEPKQRKVRQKANIPENETKEQRFIRVALPRIRKALKVVSTLKNLSNSRVYGYTTDQVERITNALKMAVSEVERSFTKVKDQEISIDLTIMENVNNVS